MGAREEHPQSPGSSGHPLSPAASCSPAARPTCTATRERGGRERQRRGGKKPSPVSLRSAQPSGAGCPPSPCQPEERGGTTQPPRQPRLCKAAEGSRHRQHPGVGVTHRAQHPRPLRGVPRWFGRLRLHPADRTPRRSLSVSPPMAPRTHEHRGPGRGTHATCTHPPHPPESQPLGRPTPAGIRLRWVKFLVGMLRLMSPVGAGSSASLLPTSAPSDHPALPRTMEMLSLERANQPLIFCLFFFFSLPNEIKTPLTSLLQLQLDLSTLSQDYRTGQGRQVENNPVVPISTAKISAISRPFTPVGSSLHPPRC